MMRTPAMINVRTATELFGFTMIKRVSPLYGCSPGKGYETDGTKPGWIPYV